MAHVARGPRAQPTKRADLEPIIHAAASVTNHNDIVVIGGRSILGSYPDAPSALLISAEADLYVRDGPQLSGLIDGTLGELSPFHETSGYYAQRVEEGTAVLPSGWQGRLVPVCNPNTRGATGWCLEPHDLAIARLVAGRPKDLDYVRTAEVTGRSVKDPVLPDAQTILTGRGAR